MYFKILMWCFFKPYKAKAFYYWHLAGMSDIFAYRYAKDVTRQTWKDLEDV